jgi:hypothetical protein
VSGAIEIVEVRRGKAMKFTDGWLLLKKIAVGLVITIVPLAIIAGSLWGVQKLRSDAAPSQSDSSVKVSHEN